MATVSAPSENGKPRKRDFYSIPDRKPLIAPPQLDNIPDELRTERRWVLWRLEWREDRSGGEWAKVPCQPNGRRAKSNNPSTWSTFEEVAAVYARGGFDGIGFMLGDGFVGIDLDDCRDTGTRKFTKSAKAIGKRLATYAEISPSGTGVKLIGRGAWHGQWNRKALPDGEGEIEVYPSGRFFTITGNLADDAGVADIQSALDELVQQFANPTVKKTDPQSRIPSPPRRRG